MSYCRLSLWLYECGGRLVLQEVEEMRKESTGGAEAKLTTGSTAGVVMTFLSAKDRSSMHKTSHNSVSQVNATVLDI